MITTIQNIIDALTIPPLALENTVDKLEFGSPDTIVTGVALTFLATQEIIEKAKALGVNLIVSHEGIFYSHRFKGELLQADPVYQKKCQAIEESQMAIYRYHDHIHRYVPDGITAGLLRALKWESYEIKNLQIASIVEIPEIGVQDVITHVKRTLGLEQVRFTGDLSMPSKRIGILVGYRGGGETARPLFEQEDLDLIIYGEGPEWETPEYVRDAVHQGREKALLVLGHAESEAPGMEILAKQLQEKFPDVPVNFIPQKPVFQIV